MIELRNSSWEVRATEDSRTVEGYALKFNKESNDLGGFNEIIKPEALDGILIKSDILCLLNHKEDRGILARSRFGIGSLKLEVDAEGLKYRFIAPQTSLGDELLEYLKRGDISTSSFCFTTDNDIWEQRGNGNCLRTITKFKELFDVSPVYKPAYPDTTVALRSMNQFIKETEHPLMTKAVEDLKGYFELLKNKIN